MMDSSSLGSSYMQDYKAEPMLLPPSSDKQSTQSVQKPQFSSYYSSQQSQLNQLLGATTDKQALIASKAQGAHLNNGKGTSYVPTSKPITQMAPKKGTHQTTKVGSIQAQRLK